MKFPIPPYQVIDITSDKPSDIREYILNALEKVTIPNKPRDRIGVTIRVSMLSQFDKLSKHGGLHIIDKEEIVRRILEKYQQYGPNSKIIIQHTVDARCSGTILKEDDSAIIETIPGDAPPLLEGQVSIYEKWIFSLKSGKWIKEKAYGIGDRQESVLVSEDLEKFGRYVMTLPNNVYLEWSISKFGEFFFYEYCKLNN